MQGSSGFHTVSMGSTRLRASSADTRVITDMTASTRPGCHHAWSVASPRISVRAGMNPETTAARLYETEMAE